MPASLACRVGAPAPTTRPGSACSRAQLARGASRPARVGRDVAAKAGYGFLEDEDGAQGTRVDEGKLYVPRYGLTVNQMQALGITNDSFLQREEPDPASISAKAFYVGDEITETTRQTTRMGGPGMRPPGQAPPDLPSLLLDGRICYIGMPLVPQVSELVISELLWLNYSNPEKPVYLYLNSTGSQTDGPQKQAAASRRRRTRSSTP
ncbi:unnamed protein product [Pedinophyceae sp. YPF-701]|nr:unnamed protein product [Pedinophyceae sp. YPF-701]